MTVRELELEHFLKSCHTLIDQVISQSYQRDIEQLLEQSRLNQTPISPHERSHLRSLVDDAEDELKQCDDCIAQAEAALAKLREQRLQISKRTGLRSSLLSPIRRLPVEVLGRIFELCVWDRPIELKAVSSYANTEYSHLKFTIRGQVFTLTLICSAWRQIALSNTILWRDLALNTSRVRNRHATTKFPTSWITDCLSRSRNMPLYLNIYSNHQGCPPPFPEALDALIACSSRWGTLHLRCSETTLCYLRSRLEFQFHSGASVANLLKDLSVSATHRGTTSDEEVVKLLETLARSPCLRYLYTSYLRIPNQMVLSNLLALNVRRYVGPSLAVLLAQCPSLQDLTLHRITSRDGSDSSSNNGVFHHKHLSVLHLHSDSGDGNVFNLGIWRSIHLPALARLSISTYGSIPDMDALDEFNAMLVRSRCVLAEIKLVGRSEPWGNYITDISSGLGLVLDENDANVLSRVYHHTDSTQSDVWPQSGASLSDSG